MFGLLPQLIGRYKIILKFSCFTEDPQNFIDPDVIACLEDILDTLCGNEERPDRGKKGTFKSIVMLRLNKIKYRLPSNSCSFTF